MFATFGQQMEFILQANDSDLNRFQQFLKFPSSIFLVHALMQLKLIKLRFMCIAYEGSSFN